MEWNLCGPTYVTYVHFFHPAFCSGVDKTFLHPYNDSNICYSAMSQRKDAEHFIMQEHRYRCNSFHKIFP